MLAVPQIADAVVPVARSVATIGLSADLPAIPLGSITGYSSSAPSSGREVMATVNACASREAQSLRVKIDTLITIRPGDWKAGKPWIIDRVGGLERKLADLGCAGRRSRPAGDQSGKPGDSNPRGDRVRAAYDYQWSIPWLPAAGKIDICKLTRSGGECRGGSYDRMLLIVAPDKCIRGGVIAKGLRYRAAVLIGADFCPTGSSYSQAPSGKVLPGGHTIRLSFDPSSGPGFGFLANMRFDSRTNGSKWGDFLRFGGSTTNTSRGMDLYLQKSWFYGHVGWSDKSGRVAKDVPHSDLIQPAYGHAKKVRIANVEAHWGFQTFFVKGSNIVGGRSNPLGTLELINVAGYGTPDPEALGGNGIPGRAKFIFTVDQHGGGYRTTLRNVSYQPWGIYPRPYGGYSTLYKPVGSVSYGTPPDVKGDTYAGARFRIKDAATLLDVMRK